MQKTAKMLSLLLLSIALAGCNNADEQREKKEPKSTENETETTEGKEAAERTEAIDRPGMEEDTLSHEPLEVTFDMEVVYNEGKAQFIGKTNLPEGMQLMISLKNDIGYSAQDKSDVQAGTFKTGTFSNKGNPLEPGTYTVEILTPTENVQPESVRNRIGDKRVNLIGEHIYSDEVWGKQLKYSETFVISHN